MPLSRRRRTLRRGRLTRHGLSGGSGRGALGRRRGRRRRLSAFAGADRIAELPDAVTESFGQIGQAARPEYDEGHGSDEQQVDRVLDAHRRSG